MSNFSDFLNEQLKAPEFKAEYDALESEFAVIQATIDAQKASDISKKGLENTKCDVLFSNQNNVKNH